MMTVSSNNLFGTPSRYCFHLTVGIGIQFEQNTYLYLESDGTDMVCARLEGEADREIVVSFELTSGSALGWLAY